MEIRQIQFYNAPDDQSPLPYITGHTPNEFNFDGKEGSILFDGHYFVEDHAPPYEGPPYDDIKGHRFDQWLPKKAMMITLLAESETVSIADGMYMVEIYKRITHELTDQYIDLEGHEGKKISYNTSSKQTIFFKVLETLDFLSK